MSFDDINYRMQKPRQKHKCRSPQNTKEDKEQMAKDEFVH